MFWKRRSECAYWLTDDIAFGPQPDARDWRRLRDSGVRCVVDLRSEAPDNQTVVASHGFEYLRRPIAEGEAPSQQALHEVTGWILDRIERCGPVLVHCREGRGRSAVVAIASLVRLGVPLADAYRMLMKARPSAAINEAQLKAVERFASLTSRTEA